MKNQIELESIEVPTNHIFVTPTPITEQLETSTRTSKVKFQSTQ